MEVIRPVAASSEVSEQSRREFSNLAKHIRLQMMGFVGSQEQEPVNPRIKQLAKNRTHLIPKARSRNLEKELAQESKELDALLSRYQPDEDDDDELSA